MTPGPLQAVFLPTIPWELPAIAVSAGFVLLFVGVADGVGTGNVGHWEDLYGGERALILTLLAVGVLVAALPAFRSRALVWYYVFVLAVLGRVIEGALIVRFFAKAFSVFAGEGGDTWLETLENFASAVVNLLVDRVVRVVLTGLISTATVVVVLVAFLRNSPTDALVWTAMAYTVGRFGVTAVAVVFQLREVVDRFQQLNLANGYALSVGLVLTIAGAEVFDLPPFLGLVTIPTDVLHSPTGDLALRFGGWIGLLVGMVLGFLVLGRSIDETYRKENP